MTITELKEPESGNGPLMKYILPEDSAESKKRFVFNKVFPSSHVAVQLDACGKRSQLIKIEPAAPEDKAELTSLHAHLMRSFSVSLLVVTMNGSLIWS
jgi:hypothetical protein